MLLMLEASEEACQDSRYTLRARRRIPKHADELKTYRLYRPYTLATRGAESPVAVQSAAVSRVCLASTYTVEGGPSAKFPTDEGLLIEIYMCACRRGVVHATRHVD